MKSRSWLLLFVCLLVGCARSQYDNTLPTTKKVHLIYDDMSNRVFSVEHEGHEYIIASGNGKAIIHSESCPCKEGK